MDRRCPQIAPRRSPAHRSAPSVRCVSTITVEPAALTRLAGRLDDVAAELGAAARELSAGAVPGDLADAVDDFCASWRWALGRAGEAAAAAAGQLRDSATRYSTTDAAFVGTLV